MRIYNSKISNLTKEKLQELVDNSHSLSDVLRSLNLHTSSGNFRTLKRKLEKENIEYSNIKNEKFQISSFRKKIPLSEILIENSTYSNPNLLKRRLIKEDILKLQCQICNLGPSWNDKPLCLQIDHINGQSTDNRLNNLRLLCPNCHSQTDTYAAKNKINNTLLKKEIITTAPTIYVTVIILSFIWQEQQESNPH